MSQRPTPKLDKIITVLRRSRPHWLPTAALCERAGCTRRTLLDWNRAGVLASSRHPGVNGFVWQEVGV